jgi:NADH-quinone oxidoreductase subunit J
LFQTLLFYFFAAVLIGAALGVIFSRNPVYAVLFLVLAFFQSAVLWLLAEAEFLAIVLVLVYVGAVMVLFLFVVMMLDITVEKIRGGFTRYAPIGLLITALMVVELVQVIWLRGSVGTVAPGFQPTPEGYSNTEALGAILYTVHA